MLPQEGDFFDLKLDRNEDLKITFIGRFEVLKRDPDSDRYIIQLKETRQEKDPVDEVPI
jgi:hypothetical protein